MAVYIGWVFKREKKILSNVYEALNRIILCARYLYGRERFNPNHSNLKLIYNEHTQENFNSK
jgi:hypothetical protein